MKKMLGGLLAICLLLPFVWPCQMAGAAGKDITITVFHHMSEQTKRDGLQKVCDNFRKINPNVNFEISAVDDGVFASTLKTKIAAGDAPDIIFGRPKNYADLVKAERLLELTGQPFLKNFIKSTYESITINKKVYAVPVDVGGVAVFYNKALFKKAGVTVPKTQSAFIRVMKKLKAKGITPFTGGFKSGGQAEALFRADLKGGALRKMPTLFADIMSGKKKWSDFPEVKKSLKRVAKYLKYYVADPFSLDFTRSINDFAIGKAAMDINGPWSIGVIRAANPKGNFGIFPLPSFNRPADNYMDFFVDDCWMVSASTKHKATVIDFLAFMSTKKQAAVFCKSAGTISAVKGTDLEPLDPMAKDLVQIINSGKVYNMESGTIFSGQYQAIYNEQFTDFCANENRAKEIDQFIRSLDKLYQNI